MGGFFGDEGKGKVLAYLALRRRPAIGVRGGVGTNAGHTIEHDGKVYRLRMVPSLFLHKECRLMIGAGVAVDPQILLREIEETKTADRLQLDYQCTVIEQSHVENDKTDPHLARVVATVGSGSGPAVADRVKRIAKLAKDHDALKPYCSDVAAQVNDAIDRGLEVIVEGTQGLGLSLYYGTYPFVTSKDTSASTICADVGVGPKKIDEVIVVFKAFVTRVGTGPLLGELEPKEVERRGWVERGTVSGRLRRAAPFNFELARLAVMINSATGIALTKLDLLYPACRGSTSYHGLPMDAKTFIGDVEKRTGIPVVLIGTGPDAASMIDRSKEH